LTHKETGSTKKIPISRRRLTESRNETFIRDSILKEKVQRAWGLEKQTSPETERRVSSKRSAKSGGMYTLEDKVRELGGNKETLMITVARL